MKPYFLVPFSVLLTGCIINTGTLASGNASSNRANVNAQANTQVETKVDSSVSNQANTNTNVTTTTNTGVNTNIATKLPGPTAPPLKEDLDLVAWLDIELVPGKNMVFSYGQKVEFKFAERPDMTRYQVVVKRLGDVQNSNAGGLISNNSGGYKVSGTEEIVVPAGALTAFEKEGGLPIFSWDAPPSGEYAYQASAHHKSGEVLTSQWIKFTVWAPPTATGTVSAGGGNVIANGGGN